MLIAAAVLVLDWRGAQLTTVDLASPLVGESVDDEEAALQVLRAEVRQGLAPIAEYKARREALSSQRFKALFAPLMKATQPAKP